MPVRISDRSSRSKLQAHIADLGFGGIGFHLLIAAIVASVGSPTSGKRTSLMGMSAFLCDQGIAIRSRSLLISIKETGSLALT
jgi:hypothetical protein